jgi:hypothetical protein
MANTRIKYVDGTSTDITVSIRQRCQAEQHAKAAGWGTAMESVVQCNTYASYAKLRSMGDVTQPFDAWADTVESIEDISREPKPEDDGDSDLGLPVGATEATAA